MSVNTIIVTEVVERKVGIVVEVITCDYRGVWPYEAGDGIKDAISNEMANP